MTGAIDRFDGLQAIGAGAAGVVGSYAVAGATPAFVAAPVDAFLVRATPGVVVAFAIQALGDLGQRLAFALAVALAAALLGLAALAGLAAGRRTERPAAAVGVAGALSGLAAAALTGATGTAVGAGGGVALAIAVGELTATSARSDAAGRRRVLRTVAGTLGLGGVAAVRGVVGATGGPNGRAGDDDSGVPLPEAVAGDAVRSRLRAADRASLDVPGLEPLVSEAFYQVDINSVDPVVDAADWSLAVTGAVETELSLSYDDLRAAAPEHRFVTLRCVGDPLNGRKMDTALWTGVPVAPLLERVGPRDGCGCVVLRAVDGYFVEFPIDALRSGLLAYGMNGRTLPRPHGAPVRALVPGHWGEVNVKWLTEIEVLERRVDGYWEQRGWHGTGPVEAVAKLHAVERLDDGRVRVGGHAYAGTRGVSRVEVSTDAGWTWTTATLSAPLPGDGRRDGASSSRPAAREDSGGDVWRQWAHTYDPPDGDHEVVVRMVDGRGVTQSHERSRPYPRGATGLVRKTVRG